MNNYIYDLYWAMLMNRAYTKITNTSTGWELVLTMEHEVFTLEGDELKWRLTEGFR